MEQRQRVPLNVEWQTPQGDSIELEYEDDDPNIDPDKGLAFKEFLEDLKWALERLENENHRDVFLLIYIYDYTYEEAAQILNAFPGTVRVWLYRARLQIRDLLLLKPIITWLNGRRNADYCQAFILCDVHGLSCEEAAKRLRVQPAQVEKLRDDARKNLAEFIREQAWIPEAQKATINPKTVVDLVRYIRQEDLK